MDASINKKEFCQLMDQLSKSDRLTVARELCVASESRLESKLIPGAMISEIVATRTRVLVKRKVSTWTLWKLWVFVMKPEGDLKNWRMTTNQCYRLQPQTVQFKWARSRTSQTRQRRSSIHDCNGNAVPRRWLDKFAPHIKTQADWDAGSIYRRHQ
jgi:hypothetical protein